MTGYDNNNPILENAVWDRTKAEYCAREEIDLHIDDSDVYGQYFTTSYLKYNPKGVM